jgi:class 3 adenylate cyclase
METDSHSFQFKDKASFPRHSLVLLFDIEGFSRFFSQPDVEIYVPRLLNHVFRFVSLAIHGGPAPWVDTPGNWPGTQCPWPIASGGAVTWPALPAPQHSKFLGDGALYIWNIGHDKHALTPNHMQDLFFRLSVLRRSFPALVGKLADDIPVANIPLNIRFGMAAGTVYTLHYAYNARTEYMGYAINLASRLQKYCPEIGFIASARVEIPNPQLQKIGFSKVIARKLKGFPREVVIVRRAAFDQLPADRRDALFIDPEAGQAPTAAEFEMALDPAVDANRETTRGALSP